MTQPKLAIIILNWNNWNDTCECMASLLENTYQNFQIILLDNGSNDDSIKYIQSWAKGRQLISIGPLKSVAKKYKVDFKKFSLNEIQDKNYKLNTLRTRLLIIENNENIGFARGCNTGIRYALRNHFENILLLNNDTTVDKKCIEILIDFNNNNKQYAVLSPKIYYYDKPNQIWNFGGKLTLNGSRKYYCQNKIDTNNIKEEVKEITFITGCALFARTEIFEKYGLLSEKFFFGEEDYEFSLRMKNLRIKMAAIASAKVYHKIGLSSNIVFSENHTPYIFIGCLNRFLNMKSYYSFIYWNIWRVISLLYIFPMLIIKKHIPIDRSIQFIMLLMQYSNKFDKVDKKIFHKISNLLK